ncbi:MAG TPA: YbaL family putative K(+) efflux transporter [Candidatus Limnocylindria bacterium]|nr:YbaL family putative K(+) efflux transporter [Candidatus Limnocylindria bacterium]
MPHNVALITTLVAALGAALAFGFLAARFKLPVLVGYLAAGIVIGPFTPGFVADAELSAQFAEIGVMLLMFGVGLHFSIDELLAVRKIAVPGAIVQITVATLLGLALSNLWGWKLAEGLVFGLTLSVASTVVLLRALESRGILETVNGHIAVGWLIVEDLVTVLVLVLMPPLSLWLGGSGGGQVTGQDLFTALALTLGKVALFVGFMVIGGRRLVPWIAWHIARVGPRELFTLCVIAIAMGIAYGAAELFGVSFALGAFFAGMVMRESPLSHRAAEESLPFRDSFSVLFFVSVGMLFDPQVLIHEPLRIVAVVAIIVIGKSLAAFVLVLLFGYPLNTALTVSAGLAQIGEFSFILAGLGMSLGILPEAARSLILAGAIISIAVNPLVFHAIEPLQVWIRAKSKRAQLFERSEDPLATLPMTTDLNRLSGHVVIVGYGRVGRRIGAALAAQGISFVLAEENREIIQAAREQGIAAVSGDATEPMVLVQAHIHRARLLVIATPDTLNVRRMIEIARTVNPRIETVVRTHSEQEAELLEKEGAGKIFLGEHELATSMSQYVLGRYAVKVEQAS